ncbi:hypothetical protein GX51_06068 [Blastomyces parvus]|uniref:Uncharacterized protein n=1 Tax=Blastomyces parvus TaxID=2060905 RepID=A0A2B7WTN7_9EURO|nr:hypothetical protein GX51_06068 [Blastomyces parvus]
MTHADNQDQATHASSQINHDGPGKAHQDSTNVANGVNDITQTDERSEICVSPSWQTDRERKERKKELKRIAKEKKELERSLKYEAKKTDQSPFSEPRRLTKKPPSKTPSRASSIRSVLPRSSTAPSILALWSNTTSKDNPVQDKTGPDASIPDMGTDKTDDPPQPTKPVFTGHLPQRFGGKITPDPEYYKASSRAINSNSPSSMRSSPTDKPKHHLHMAKKHSDLRAAAKAFRSRDSVPQDTDTAPPRSSWSQELTRRLSNSNGKKLQRRSLKAEYEPHMYSLRGASTNKENENDTTSRRKTEKSVPLTPTSSHFHATTGISSPSPQNRSQITVVQPDNRIVPPQNTAGELNHEAHTPRNSVNDTNGSSEPQEQPPTISVIPPNSPRKTTHSPSESQRKHGRRHSWSEILTNSDHIAGISLKRRGQGREPPQTSANGGIDEFKTSGPYESNYGSNGVSKSHATHSDPSLTPASWHVAPENIGIAGDFPQVQSGSSSPNTTPTDLPTDPSDLLKDPTIIDPNNTELGETVPTVKQRENPMRIPPKIINRDVPFKSSPLAGPPLNTQDDEKAPAPAQTDPQRNADTSSKAKDGKSGFSFSRILRHERKKEKSSTSFGRRYSLKGKLATATGQSKQQPKAPLSGSNELQKQQDTDKKASSKLSYLRGAKLEATSRPPSASSRQLSLIAVASNDKSSDIKIPPKSPKRNSGVFPTPTSTRPSSASGVETMSISSNGTETPGKKKRSISVDISKSQVTHDPWKERFSHKPSPGHASPPLSSSQSTPIISTFPSAKQPATNGLASSDLSLRPSERHHQTHSGPIFDSRPDSSTRRSLANNVGNGRVASQRPARRGTPVAKMFVICCQCRYWHDMPSDVYAKLAFPNGPPQIEPLIADGSYSSPHHAQLPMASGGFATHGGGSSSTVTETSSGASNNALDNKSPRDSRPSSSSSSSSNNFTVTCCWCAHRMVKTCCAGWTTIVYLHERHH